jgi:hypothetical protein
MKTMLAFVKWIFARMGKGLFKQHEKFKEMLVDETPLALFAWFIISVLTSIFFLLVFGGLSALLQVQIPVLVWFAYMVSCVFYLLYTGFSVMYNAFKAERAELFETIKHGR